MISPWFPTDKCFIDGAWVAPRSKDTLPLENPSDGSVIGAIARGEAADIDLAVEAARRSLDGEWGRCRLSNVAGFWRRLAGPCSRKSRSLPGLRLPMWASR